MPSTALRDAGAFEVSGITENPRPELPFAAWQQRLAAYAKPNASRAVLQLVNTALPFLASMAGLLYGLAHGYCLAGSIGLHHIHHLACKIPNYRLRACFAQNPELQQAKRLTLWASIKSVRLALWDEERRKLVSFLPVAASCA